MGQHKQAKLRGGVVRTANEYKAVMAGAEKPKPISKRELERRIGAEIRERTGINRLMREVKF
jgi:hypothetical protein